MYFYYYEINIILENIYNNNRIDYKNVYKDIIIIGLEGRIMWYITEKNKA